MRVAELLHNNRNDNLVGQSRRPYRLKAEVDGVMNGDTSFRSGARGTEADPSNRSWRSFVIARCDTPGNSKEKWSRGTVEAYKIASSSSLRHCNQRNLLQALD